MQVEAGQGRTKSLEQEMLDSGLFDTSWSLGDIVALDDESEGRQGSGGGDAGDKKARLAEFPPVEGGETLQEMLGQYKKCCLNKRALHKTTRDRLKSENASGHETPI